MSDIGKGWVRTQGDKFYAYTKADAVYVDENDTKTLQDVLGEMTFEDLVDVVSLLQTRVSKLQDLVTQLVEGYGYSNVQTGVYTITHDMLVDFQSRGTIDDSVMYLLTSTDTAVSNGVTIVKWLSPTGEILTTQTYTNTLGDIRTDIPFFGTKTIYGTMYYFDPATDIIDLSTGNPWKGVLDVTSTTVTCQITKNNVLTVTATA